ncbi:MAG: hypothetical protein GC154_18155 [bacterium]|nr:hypothetical protein [bacterium]
MRMKNSRLLTPILTFPFLVMAIYAGASIANYYLADGANSRGQNAAQVFVVKNSVDDMFERARRLDPLFTEPPAWEIRDDELEDSNIGQPEVSEALDLCNEAIDGFEADVVMRKTYPQRRELPFSYSEYTVAAASPYTVIKKKIEFSGLPEEYTRTTITRDDSRITIMPRIKMVNGEARAIFNYIRDDNAGNYITPECSLFGFGRGFRLSWFSRSVPYFQNGPAPGSLLPIHFKTVKSNPNLLVVEGHQSGWDFAIHLAPLISFHSYDVTWMDSRIWIDRSKGNVWVRQTKNSQELHHYSPPPNVATPSATDSAEIHLQYARALSNWIKSGSAEKIIDQTADEIYMAEAFDWRQTGGVWFPWRVRITQFGEMCDYAITAVRRISDVKAYRNELRASMTPRPEDTLIVKPTWKRIDLATIPTAPPRAETPY